MADAGRLFVSLALDATRYAAGLSEITKKTNKTVQSIQRELRGMVNFALGAGGFYAVVRGIQAVSASAAAQEESIARLSQTLKNNYEFTDRNLKALADQASELQKVTRYGDEMTMAAQGQLMALSGLTTEMVIKLTPAMQDMAAGMRMDLVSAAELMGKSIGGSTNMLKRYGIEMDTAKDATGRANDILGEVNKKFKDLASVKGYTTSITQLKNAFGDLNEEIGFLITGTEGGIAGEWANIFGGMASNMQAARKAAQDLAKYLPEGPQGIVDKSLTGGATVRYYTDEQKARMAAAIEREAAAQERKNKADREAAKLAEPKAIRAPGINPTVSYGYGIERGKKLKEAMELYHIEDDLADWYRLQDAEKEAAEWAQIYWEEMNSLSDLQAASASSMWIEFVEDQNEKLRLARDNFDDYAWAIKDTWAYAIESMISGNKAFELSFKNLVLMPMVSVASGRAANYLVDQLLGGLSSASIFQWGGRTIDAGTSTQSVGKQAVGGGGDVYVQITGPTAEQIVAIVDNNMANNGVLRR